MIIKPLGDKVLLKPAQAETKTAGGILLPETQKEKTTTAEVVAIGDDPKINVSVGDKVIFDRYEGIPVRAEEPMLLISIKDIIAVVEE